MLCKIYFFFFVIGFIGSVFSIVRSLSKEDRAEETSKWDLMENLGPFFFFTSFIGITFVQFNALRSSINVPVSIFVGFFFTYFSQVFIKADQKGSVL
ncbi:hypothetical protein ACJVC5_13285 [Peredibacter sp. HCB2-198]|uniref:hypothetical protein n=1 Tax=Peredibacter sp. HCB2-198 TaxID=3383025 RepID=UPI0038B62AE5